MLYQQNNSQEMLLYSFFYAFAFREYSETSCYPFLYGVGLTDGSLCSGNAAGDATVALTHAPQFAADFLCERVKRNTGLVIFCEFVMKQACKLMPHNSFRGLT